MILTTPYVKQPCLECMQGKATNGPYSSKMKTATKIGERIHIDIMEFSPISSDGHRYIALATDEFNHFAFSKPIHHKHQAYTWIRTLEQRIPGHFIEFIRADQEFYNTKIKHYLDTCGKIAETSWAHMKQQAGTSERHNRVFLDAIRTVLTATKLPATLWPHVVYYVLH
jgi:hypothetical protein